MTTSTLILRLVCLLTLALFFGCISGDQPLFKNQAENASELQAEIEAICKQWRKAMVEDKDLLKVASFYADNGLIVSENGLYFSGREAIDDYWERVPEPLDWKLTTYFVDGRDTIIIQRGRSDLTVSRDGQKHTSTVEFTHVWQRQEDGSLKLVVDSYWR